MRLIFVEGICVKRIGGNAMMDVSNGIIVEETPEVAGAPFNRIGIADGVPVLIPEPPLTPEQVAAIEAKAQLDLAIKKVFHVAFNHENRIRVLEGKAAITKEQFKAALAAL